jgi:hypothetical protein
MNIEINPQGEFAAHRVFILLKMYARQQPKIQFVASYMKVLLFDGFELFSEKLSELIKKEFGEHSGNDFYIGWLFDQFIKKYGTEKKENNKPVVKDFNYYYKLGYDIGRDGGTIPDNLKNETSVYGGYKAGMELRKHYN